MYVPTRRWRILRTTLVAIGAAGLALFAASPALAQEVSVEPASGVADGDTVTVTASGLDAIEGQQAAVTQCGNADSDGNALAASAAEDEATFAANCFGTEALGTPQVVLVGVSDGTLTAEYVVKTSGIGTNGATCIPNADAELPCSIVIADLNTQGQALTVSGAFDVGTGEDAAEGEAEGEAEAEAEEEAPEDLPSTGAGILSMTLAGIGIAGTGAAAVGLARLRRRS